MSRDPSLAKVISVAPRFARSISLERDWGQPEALDGYVLTPAGREVIQRIAAVLQSEAPPRAWTVTGPYGSGKSALALFMSEALGDAGPAGIKARAILKREHPDLWKSLLGKASPLGESGTLCPILVTGSRKPIEKALAAALDEAVRRTVKGRLPRSFVSALSALKSDTVGEQQTSFALEVFEEALALLCDPGGPSQGLLLVIDELGKFLEFAASHPERGDLFILQSLAELAARAERPFMMVTILHQAIDRYTEQIVPSRRREWAKVQGRFEDIAFEEAAEHLLRLLARAVHHQGSEGQRHQLETQGKRLAQEAWQHGFRPGTMPRQEAVRLLTECTPLHPTTTLILGPLFRRLAQNERSLFAFLTSGEAFGFQKFLHEEQYPEVYRLDRLFDYVTTSLGAALYTLHRGKVWAEVQTVLERLHEASPIEVRLAKVVGLLQALGFNANLPASKELLQFALTGPTVTKLNVERALAALEAKSVLVFRRHANSYALWEGSDVDIEARVTEAHRAVDTNRSLQSQLSEAAPPRPLVARSHSYRTGTLRYFAACYADRHSLPSALQQPPGSADGRIVYCLPLNADDRKTIKALLKSTSQKESQGIIVALPRELIEVEELCRELASLRWVQQNTPELAGDATARRELRARITSIERNLTVQSTQAFYECSDRSNPCQWFYRGKEIHISSSRALNEFLSKVCDELYSATPIWRNELINRRSLSSAAAAARRNLIEVMIEHPDEEALGITGNPPERSMYESILRATGLHRPRGGIWGFYPPTPKSDQGTVLIWNEIERFFAECESKRRPLTGLYEQLRKPPFGLKEGVLPVIIAAALLHFEDEVALYEEGTFVPFLTIAIFERLLGDPDIFTVQRCRLTGPRAVVFRRYADMVRNEGAASEAGSPQLLAVVRPLAKFVRQLPEYVSLTQQLPPVAKAVLQVIQKAKEPDTLLFSELPAACGFASFGPRGAAKIGEVGAFFGTLRGALAELQQAYPKLQAAIEKMLLQAFGLTEPLASARPELTHRALLVNNLTVDPKLKSFVVRAGDTTAEDAFWLESLAALLGGKPSRAWNDQDRSRFEVNLAMTARLFRHFEVLAHEQGAALLDGDARSLRVSVTVPQAEEVERVVRIPAEKALAVRAVQAEVRRILEEARLLRDTELSVALLADLSRQMLLADQAGATSDN